MTTSQQRLLIKLYSNQNIPLDRLPYTEEFHDMCEKFNNAHVLSHTKNEIWNFLLSIRKAGHLPPRRKVKNATRNLGIEGHTKQ